MIIDVFLTKDPAKILQALMACKFFFKNATISDLLL